MTRRSVHSIRDPSHEGYSRNDVSWKCYKAHHGTKQSNQNKQYVHSLLKAGASTPQEGKVWNLQPPPGKRLKDVPQDKSSQRRQCTSKQKASNKKRCTCLMHHVGDDITLSMSVDQTLNSNKQTISQKTNSVQFQMMSLSGVNAQAQTDASVAFWSDCSVPYTLFND